MSQRKSKNKPSSSIGIGHLKALEARNDMRRRARNAMIEIVPYLQRTEILNGLVAEAKANLKHKHRVSAVDLLLIDLSKHYEQVRIKRAAAMVQGKGVGNIGVDVELTELEPDDVYELRRRVFNELRLAEGTKRLSRDKGTSLLGSRKNVG